jgi:SPP1 family predicted phage head-tail adaptor
MTDRVARMRERVRIETLTAHADESGGQMSVWEDAGEIWANVNEDSSRERVASGLTVDAGAISVLIRSLPWLTVDRHRLVWRGQSLNIRGIVTADLQRRYQRLDCEKGLPA